MSRFYTILLVSVLSTGLAYAQGQGWFLGAGVGVTQTKFKTHDVVDFYNRDATPDGYSDVNRTATTNKTPLTILLHGGYDFVLAPKVTLDVAAFLDYQFDDKEVSYTHPIVPSNPTSTIYSSSGTILSDYGLVVAPGYKLTPNDTVYLDLGVKSIQLEYETSLKAGDLTSDKLISKGGNLTAFLYGLGFKHQLQDNISLFAQVDYAAFPTDEIKRSELSGDNLDRNETINYDISKLNFAAGINYNF